MTQKKKIKRYGYYSEGIYFNNSKGEIFTSDIFIKNFEKLIKNEKATAIGRLSKKGFHPKYRLKENINFVTLSYYKSIRSLIVKLPLYLFINISKILHFTNNIDILYVAASGPISIILIWIMSIKRKKVLLFIRQDTKELIKVKYNNAFIPKLIANNMECIIERIVKNNNNVTIFAFGDVIYSRYSKISNLVINYADSRYSESEMISPNKIIRKNKHDYLVLKILYVGRLAKGKGLEFLIETLNELPNKKFRLTIIGEGSIKKNLINLVENAGLCENVEFKGYIPYGIELLQEYSRYDVLILPSFSEGLPQVILEAMARGVPVVATRAGGITTLIKNNINGFLFEAGDKKGLLKIINYIQNSKLNTTQIRQNALKTAKRFCFEKQQIKIKMALNI